MHILLIELTLKGFLVGEQLAKSDISLLTDNELSRLNCDIKDGILAKKQFCDFVDSLLTTCNPINKDDWIKPKTHPCKMDIKEIIDFDKDYANLANSVQKHVCSSAYCLKRDKNNELKCRFHFLFETTVKSDLKFEKINTRDGSLKYKAEVLTPRNDTRINRHQRAQL